MKIKPFALERYFAKHEFSARYLLSSSDCGGWPQADILRLADDEARGLWEGLRLGYTESRGLPLLRKEIAGLYQRVDADDVLVVAPEEGIFIALNCLLEEGDHVLCTYPGYQSLYEIARSLGCRVDQWRPDENKGWKFDVDFLSRNIKPATKAIIVNFPHNPTGYLPSRDDYLRVVEIARANGAYLFSDEMYRFLELRPEDRLPSACELYDKAITLFGMSKAFGMAGARIGWLATRDKKLYEEMSRFKDYTTICAAAPSEILSLIALRAKDVILDEHRARISRNLGLLDAFFKKYSSLFGWIRPKAGTIGFPRLLSFPDPARFCEEVIEKTGVMLLPSTVYGYDQPHFRVGFGREDMPEALGRLDDFLDHAPPGRTAIKA